jgi:hypothetical protein
MHFLSVYLAFVASLVLIVTSERLLPIPHEGPNLASNFAGLPTTPKDLDDNTIIKLLDVLEHYGLDKHYSILESHDHRMKASLDDSHALYETGNNVSTFTTIRKFSEIKRNSAPLNYHISQTSKGPQLLPIAYGPITPNIREARLALAPAVEKGFLHDFLAAASGGNVGIGLFLDIHRAALAQGVVVVNTIKNNYSYKGLAVSVDDIPDVGGYTRMNADSKGYNALVLCVVS